jgi:hypothetical protein
LVVDDSGSFPLLSFPLALSSTSSVPMRSATLNSCL